jgi:DNA-directed RNA polymerase subunit RPC12/RpoP
MAIRFNCQACKTVLKIAEQISEQKKVRCTGCGVVILLTPDEDATDGMTVSIPDQVPKKKAEDGGVNIWVMVGVGAGVLLVIIIGLWWMFSGPAERGAIEGEVTLDNQPLLGGVITFESMEATKIVIVEIPIDRAGRYSIGASQGPWLGKNKVLIRSDGGQMVPPKYNIESKVIFEVQPGSNTKKWDLRSR